MAETPGRTDQLLDEIARLIAVAIKRGAENQNAVIISMLQSGLEAPRIAELLGTTPATVRAARAKNPVKTAAS
jgi:hypothetical protein